jgi:hypothetical protein
MFFLTMHLTNTHLLAMHCILDHPTFLRPHQPAVLLTHLPRDPMGLKWRIGKNPHGPVPKYDIRGMNSATQMCAEISVDGGLA